MLSENRSLVLAPLTGLGLLVLTTPAFAHGPDAQGGSGASPGSNAPFSQQAPGQMMGGGMMGGRNGYGGMMGTTRRQRFRHARVRVHPRRRPAETRVQAE